MTPNPSMGRKGRTERIYERASDPAEAANRPLEPKSSDEPLAPRDEPACEPTDQHDPHHRLNNPVTNPDPAADSDPYRQDDDESDHASGVRGSGREAGGS